MTFRKDSGVKVLAAGTLAAILVVLPSTLVEAEVRLPKILTSHMVVQQQKPIRVWGWAEAGESIKVEFNGKTVSTKADGAGQWRVELPAMSADGKPHTMTIKSQNTIELTDVLIGEVWLGVGQSNMSRGLRYVKERARKEKMDFPNYRLFFVGLDQVPQKVEPASTKGWAPATHHSMSNTFVHPTLGPYEFSEVTYYFGRELQEKLDVPVGVISAAFPGSTATQWTPHDAQEFDFTPDKSETKPGSRYQSMLHGLPPISIRGAIYYQGENDAGNGNYDRDLKFLIEGWRTKFENPDLPFYMAQIGQTTFMGGMLRVTECQEWLAANVPHTAVVPSNDLWDGAGSDRAKIRTDSNTGWPVIAGGDPHPPNKHLMSARLARAALGDTYGKQDGEVFGPTVISHEIRGESILITFKHAGKGLHTDDGLAPNWFQISGEEKQFVKADAKIVGKDQVELHAADLKQPKHFRFAWHALARHNLYNSENLAALAYRSDAPAQQTTK